MYPPLTLLGTSDLLPVLLASALPHTGSDITQRAPSVLETNMTFNFLQHVKTPYATYLHGPLELLQSDEITDDDSVQVYDVTNLKVKYKDEEREVVARTKTNDSEKIKYNLDLFANGMLVGYGYQYARDEADRRWWLLHIRPNQPRDLHDVAHLDFSLHWKEKQDSDTEWRKTDIKASIQHEGIYVMDDWIDEKTSERKSVEMITRPDRDASEITPEEVQKFLDGRPLLAYGFEAATELYSKRWWIVTEPSKGNKSTSE